MYTFILSMQRGMQQQPSQHPRAQQTPAVIQAITPVSVCTDVVIWWLNNTQSHGKERPKNCTSIAHAMQTPAPLIFLKHCLHLQWNTHIVTTVSAGRCHRISIKHDLRLMSDHHRSSRVESLVSRSWLMEASSIVVTPCFLRLLIGWWTRHIYVLS